MAFEFERDVARQNRPLHLIEYQRTLRKGEKRKLGWGRRPQTSYQFYIHDTDKLHPDYVKPMLWIPERDFPEEYRKDLKPRETVFYAHLIIDSNGWWSVNSAEDIYLPEEYPLDTY